MQQLDSYTTEVIYHQGKLYQRCTRGGFCLWYELVILRTTTYLNSMTLKEQQWLEKSYREEVNGGSSARATERTDFLAKGTPSLQDIPETTG